MRQRLLKVTEAVAEGRHRGGKAGSDAGRCRALRCRSVVEAEGFSVVRDFVGHGIGTHMHEDPQVPNFGEAGQGMKLQGGHGDRDRAHGERRQAGCAGAATMAGRQWRTMEA